MHLMQQLFKITGVSSSRLLNLGLHFSDNSVVMLLSWAIELILVIRNTRQFFYFVNRSEQGSAVTYAANTNNNKKPIVTRFMIMEKYLKGKKEPKVLKQST